MPYKDPEQRRASWRRSNERVRETRYGLGLTGKGFLPMRRNTVAALYGVNAADQPPELLKRYKRNRR